VSEYERTIIRNRLEELPLQDELGNPKQLPDDAIEYLLEIFEWLAQRRGKETL
jgi:hypothetical protein